MIFHWIVFLINMHKRFYKQYQNAKVENYCISWGKKIYIYIHLFIYLLKSQQIAHSLPSVATDMHKSYK